MEKRIYSAAHSQREYEAVRSESRQGIQLTEEEALRLDSLISPLLMKGQSLHHICANHADEIMLNERSLYNYVNDGIFTAKNIDMPRVVRMGRRKKKKDPFKVDKNAVSPALTRISFNSWQSIQDYLSWKWTHWRERKAARCC